MSRSVLNAANDPPSRVKLYFLHDFINAKNKYKISFFFNSGRISSVGRVLDCRAGSRGFDSRDWTNTHGLKMTEK